MRPTQRSKQGWQVVFTRNRAWIAKIHAMLERNDALLQSNGALTAPDHVGAREPGTAATSERDLPPHVDEPNRRAILATAVALRRRLADQALALARTEDEIARHQEALAAQHPHHADRYRQAAEDARQGARQARQAAQRFRD